MKKVRLIARIDIKNESVIKGIHLEGLRKIGDPNLIASKYYQNGIDEILFMDAVAAYYDRNNLGEIIKRACEDIFVPITVGGGIRTLDDISMALQNGADKVSINTQAVRTPNFIKDASEKFGSQSIVSSIDAKKVGSSDWEVYIDNGREPTGIDVIEWSQELESLGAGELLITSIDQEGTKKGFDIALNDSVSRSVSIPIISSGGMGSTNHALSLLKGSNVDALAVASIIHYDLDSIEHIKETMIKNNFEVRFENSCC